MDWKIRSVKVNLILKILIVAYLLPIPTIAQDFENPVIEETTNPESNGKTAKQVFKIEIDTSGSNFPNDTILKKAFTDGKLKSAEIVWGESFIQDYAWDASLSLKKIISKKPPVIPYLLKGVKHQIVILDQDSDDNIVAFWNDIEKTRNKPRPLFYTCIRIKKSGIDKNGNMVSIVTIKPMTSILYDDKLNELLEIYKTN